MLFYNVIRLLLPLVFLRTILAACRDGVARRAPNSSAELARTDPEYFPIPLL